MKHHCSGYVANLASHNRKSYEKKLEICFDVDPYEINYDECDNDWSCFPNIAHGDILNYLVFSTNAVTFKEMKAYKSLEAHNYFTSGWVNPIIYHKALQQNKHLILGEVNHSQSLRLKTLKVWILSMEDGDILTANCTCMAGLGGSCSHIGAVLFAVETGIRLQLQSCTSRKNEWLPAHAKNAPLVKVKDLDFSSAKRKKTYVDGSDSLKMSKNPNHENPADAVNNCQLQEFLQKVKDTGTISAVLKVVKPFCNEYKTVTPLSLKDKFFDDSKANTTWHELVSHCQNIFFHQLTLSQEEAGIIQVCTKGQSKNNDWYYQRSGRITASVMKRVHSANIGKPSNVLITDICYPDRRKLILSKAIMWGKKNESKAIEKYKKQLELNHHGLKVESSGLYVNPKFPFIGASPDAIVSCSCCGMGVCEVKCPFTLRDANLEDIPDIKISYLEYDEACNLCLKKDHAYYYQIQTQIFVCNANYADFVVWTKNSLYVERILPDYGLWEDILEKAASYFVYCILPELCNKWYTKENNLKEKSEVHVTKISM